MTTTVSIDNATFTTEKLVGILQRGLDILDRQQELKLDFKELVEEAEKETKLPKKVVSKFIKARFADKAKEVVKDGELFAALTEAVDGNKQEAQFEAQ